MHANNSECWTTVTPNMERKLEATGMWLHIRLLYISWTERTTNEGVLRGAGTEREVMGRITFPGNTVREQGLEKVVITGEIEGDGARGRPRLNVMQRLSQLVSVSDIEIIKSSGHRREWKSMTDDVWTGYRNLRKRGRPLPRSSNKSFTFNTVLPSTYCISLGMTVSQISTKLSCINGDSAFIAVSTWTPRLCPDVGWPAITYIRYEDTMLPLELSLVNWRRLDRVTKKALHA